MNGWGLGSLKGKKITPEHGKQKIFTPNVEKKNHPLVLKDQKNLENWNEKKEKKNHPQTWKERKIQPQNQLPTPPQIKWSFPY